RADFTSHTANFGGEAIQLIHHGINGVLQFENLALNIHHDFARQVAAGNCSCHFGDVTDLCGEVGAHRVDRVGQILPSAGHARYHGLHTQAAFGSNFAGHACDFRREGTELFDHCVDRFFKLKDFATHVHRNLAGEVTVGDSNRDFGDVPNLVREVA